MQNAKGRRFTVAEDELIRAYFPGGGTLAVMPHLPNRSTDQVQSRARRLGLQSPYLRMPRGRQNKMGIAVEAGARRAFGNDASKNWRG